ncbi:MetS family NSS transporter small subunit [Chengkuizengella marina]|uniref:MetS family NSS transporter small subunit n=1 Tax=Chengkuizengella marina TaxID=2507566 RepID=A0A6N9PZP4_9BACL|nr:MetS family NSS transporter small subunit [Chengkuizengella marina]NBI28356.1 MetS family NSS transporter small subunit [Chengkuizengella marina]
MSAGAITMMVFGAVLLWGGAALTISIALRKQKK